MPSATTPLPATWMADLDERYRAASGLSDRRDYSIFYSQVRPWPVLLLGMNPGGDPDTWTTEKLASTDWYDHGEHEYVDKDYPLAVAMRKYCVDVFGLDSPEEVRSFPKTNLAFRRSRTTDTLGMSMRDAVVEAAPFVREIIDAVEPQLIVLEGTQSVALFAEIHTRSWTTDKASPVITTPNGINTATIFRRFSGELTSGAEVSALAIGHPSRYSGRREWNDVITVSTAAVERLNLGALK